LKRTLAGGSCGGKRGREKEKTELLDKREKSGTIIYSSTGRRGKHRVVAKGKRSQKGKDGLISMVTKER